MITLVPLFLIVSSSFVQVSRTIIKAWISLNFKQNQPQTVEITAIEGLEKSAYRLIMKDLL